MPTAILRTRCGCERRIEIPLNAPRVWVMELKQPIERLVLEGNMPPPTRRFEVRRFFCDQHDIVDGVAVRVYEEVPSR